MESPERGELTDDSPLSRDDLDVLAALSRGKSLQGVADELHLSHRSVSRQVNGICERLGVERTIQAVVWAVRRELI